jgi:hypothetical protein
MVSFYQQQDTSGNKHSADSQQARLGHEVVDFITLKTDKVVQVPLDQGPSRRQARS